VVRDGAKIVQIDPWNRLESQRGEGENETEYVLRCLRMFTVFAKAFDVHVQIVAHPAKRDPRRRDQPPEMEDVSGSQNWWNVPDQGFVVHRPKFWDAHGDRCYDAIFYQRKARFEDLGYPCAIGIRFDPIDRRFKERDLGRGEAE
jgi:twinkle protein